LKTKKIPPEDIGSNYKIMKTTFCRVNTKDELRLDGLLINPEGGDCGLWIFCNVNADILKLSILPI